MNKSPPGNQERKLKEDADKEHAGKHCVPS